MAEFLYATSHIDGTIADPTNALGNTPSTWAGVVNANTSATSRYAIGNPVDPLVPDATHTVRVVAKKGSNSNDPSVALNLYENGSLVAALVSSTTITSTTGQTLTGTFNTSDVTNADDVEIEVVISGVGGSGTARNSAQISHIEWEADTAADTPFEITQDRFRFRTVNPDSAGASASLTTPAGNPDTDANMEWNVDELFRVRFRLQSNDADGEAKRFQLYYSLNEGSYTPVTTTSPIYAAGNAVTGYTEDALAQGALGAGTGSLIWGYATKDDAIVPTAGTQSWGSGLEYCNHEFGLFIDSTQVDDGDTIDLRIYYDDGSPLESYTQTPRVTAVSGISGGSSTTVEVSTEGAGASARSGAASTNVSVSSEGAGATARSGGSEASVSISSTGGGSASQSAEGGSETTVQVSTEGSGASARAGGASVGVDISAEGQGTAARQGGQDAAVAVSSEGSGTTARSGGSEVSVAVSATGGGSGATLGSGGSSTTVNVSTEGQGTSARAGAAETNVEITAESAGTKHASGGSEVSLSASTTGAGSKQAIGGAMTDILISAMGGGSGSLSGPQTFTETWPTDGFTNSGQDLVWSGSAPVASGVVNANAYVELIPEDTPTTDNQRFVINDVQIGAGYLAMVILTETVGPWPGYELYLEDGIAYLSKIGSPVVVLDQQPYTTTNRVEIRFYDGTLTARVDDVVLSAEDQTAEHSQVAIWCENVSFGSLQFGDIVAGGSVAKVLVSTTGGGFRVGKIIPKPRLIVVDGIQQTTVSGGLTRQFAGPGGKVRE